MKRRLYSILQNCCWVLVGKQDGRWCVYEREGDGIRHLVD